MTRRLAALLVLASLPFAVEAQSFGASMNARATSAKEEAPRPPRLVEIGVAEMDQFGRATRYIKPLSEDAIEELPAQAREKYREAVSWYDVANRPRAAEAVIEAANLAPESIDLQFLAADVAVRRGMMEMGPEAQRHLDAADQIIRRLLASDKLNTEERARANRMELRLNGRRAMDGKDAVPGERQTVAARDQARTEAGNKFIESYRDLRREAAGISPAAFRLSALVGASEGGESGAGEGGGLLKAILGDSGVRKMTDDKSKRIDPFANLPGEYVPPKAQPAAPGAPGAPGGVVSNPFEAANPF